MLLTNNAHSRQYIFGDEAGDTGFAFQKGASSYFVFLLILVDDPEPMRQAIDQLRRKLKLPAWVEFKFHKTSRKHREVFLRTLKAFSFSCYALVLDKRKLPAKWHIMDDVDFYVSCFATLISQSPLVELERAFLVLDQFGPPKLTRRKLRLAVKRQFGQNFLPFEKISLKRSDGDNLLQCADMMAGALLRAYNEKDKRYFNLVKPKIVVFEDLPIKNPPS